MRYLQQFSVLVLALLSVMGGCAQRRASDITPAIQAGGPNDVRVDWQTSTTTVINRHAPATVQQDPQTGKMVTVNDGMSTDQFIATRDADYKVVATMLDVGSNVFMRGGIGSYYFGWSTPTNQWNENGHYNVVKNIQGGYVVTHGGQVGHNVNGQIGHNVSGQVDVNGNIVHSGTVNQNHQGTVTHGGTVTHEHTQPPPR